MYSLKELSWTLRYLSRDIHLELDQHVEPKHAPVAKLPFLVSTSLCSIKSMLHVYHFPILSLLNCPQKTLIPYLAIPGPAAQLHQVAPCNTQSCDLCIDGAWGAWNDWSKCTATCDVGFRVRHRDVMQRPNSCGKPALGHWAFFLWGETGMVGDTWGS